MGALKHTALAAVGLGLALAACTYDFPDKTLSGEYSCTSHAGCIDGYRCIDGVCQDPSAVQRGDSNSAGDPGPAGDPVTGNGDAAAGDSMQGDTNPGGDTTPGPRRIVGSVLGPSAQTSSSTNYRVRGMFWPYPAVSNTSLETRGIIKSTSYTIVPPVQ